MSPGAAAVLEKNAMTYLVLSYDGETDKRVGGPGGEARRHTGMREEGREGGREREEGMEGGREEGKGRREGGRPAG